MFVRALALIVVLFLGVFVAGFLFVSKKIKVGPAAAIIVLLFTGATLAFLLPAGRSFLNVPVESPDDLVARYNSAAFPEKSRDLSLYLEGETAFSEAGCADPVAAYFYNCFMPRISVAPAGDCESSWENVTQHVIVTYPDLSPIRQFIIDNSVSYLQELGATLPRSQLYNADKTFRADLVVQSVSRALSLYSPDTFEMLTAETDVSIICVNGQWRLESDAPVYRALLSALGNAESVSDYWTGYVSDIPAEVTRNAAYVPKHFSVDFYNTVSPEPDPACYGATTDPYEVMAVVEKASELLRGQQTVFNPNISFYPGTQIRYYFDDSILAIVWREEKNGTLCTYAEIKLADASQLRRKLVDDCFDPPTWDWIEATRLSEQVNAVVATGSDLYAFRNLGIFSYDGVLFRCETSYVDSCHITRDGDMLFSRRYELFDWNQAQQWITDNNIMFSLAFGPVLIENGQPVITDFYSVGEIWDGYSRAAMGQMGEKGSLHYLMLVMASDERVSVPELPVLRDPRLDELRNAMVEKGCTQAYTLDGGQTGAIIIDNEMITRPTYGWERIYCDILYFASAIPVEERLPG